MNKRLVWNFEINATHPFKMPHQENCIENHHQWESRFFWTDETIITLNGLNQNFLELTQYQLKHKQDTYFLLPNKDYNLKIRHNQLFYKPLLMRQTNAMAFGKKVKLTGQDLSSQLPDFNSNDMTDLLMYIHQQGIKMEVEKEALVYKFKTKPTTKLELARLQVKQQIYFSISIESPSLHYVEFITTQLIGTVPCTDYVSFLKSITN